MLINSNYSSSFVLRNKHLHTIIPSFFFKQDFSYSSRERITLPDKDFIDIDWLKTGNKKLVLLLHGLESTSEKFYMKHTADFLSNQGYDIAAMNYRGCSGEPNIFYKSYHSGSSSDVADVITHLNSTTQYDKLYIVGFSLGGNILLKYLAEYVEQIPTNFTKGVAISSPIDLEGVSFQLSSTFGGIYQKYFIKKLNNKLHQKANLFPNHVSIEEIEQLDTLLKFDNYYTAPVNGFKNANDYYQKCSAKPLLPLVQHQVLLINALDDPFLPESCYPFDILKTHKCIDFETPKTGGHLGFINSISKQTCWYPQRILDYFNQ